MRPLLFCILLVLPHLLMAQKSFQLPKDNIYPIDHKKAQFKLTNIFIGKENQEAKLIHYLQENIDNLKPSFVTVQKAYQKESLTKSHYTFEQYVKGVKIFRSQLKAGIDKQGYIRSISDFSFPSTLDFPDEFPSGQVLSNYLSRYDLSVDILQQEMVYFFNGEEYIPALRAEYISAGDIYREILLDHRGILLYLRDMNMYAATKDTTASGMVFNPDPLTTAEVTYGTPYVDGDNADIPELNAERVSVTLSVRMDTLDTLRLENNYVKITEHSAPVIPPAVSDTPDFSFTRSQSGFEEVNALYHISTYQEYVQQLGYDSLACFKGNCQIHVDAHGHNGQDQSSFVSGTDPPRLTFGANIPGIHKPHVNDAEDADVIIHEYGHAIVFSAAPNTNIGHERQALDEGIGDYLAVSYSKSLGEFRWRKVFNWDGHNEFWPGRNADTDKIYPDDLTSHSDNSHLTNNIYADGEIWSSALADILKDIGREVTDQIILESAFEYSSGMSMRDAAVLFLQTDTLLNAGENSIIIFKQFCDRGLLEDCELPEVPDTAQFILLLNSEKFAAGLEPAIVQFYFKENFSSELFNIQGKLMFREEVEAARQRPIYGTYRNDPNGPGLPAGMYILRVRTATDTHIFKLIRWMNGD